MEFNDVRLRYESLSEEIDAAIRDVVQSRQQQAWNQHDAKAYAALFAENGDVVNVVGWWWRSRKEIENKLSDAFAFAFRESTLTITEADVRFLTSEIAVAHTRWTMSGARTPPTIPEPRAGIQTLVLQKARRKLDDRGFPEHESRT